MITFHYLICNVPKKEKYHVMKLIFNDNKLQNNDEMFLSKNKLDNLLNFLDTSKYTHINDSKVNIDSFLKHINLFNMN